jgi:hypothetical protein
LNAELDEVVAEAAESRRRMGKQMANVRNGRNIPRFRVQPTDSSGDLTKTTDPFCNFYTPPLAVNENAQ